jgi:hypothetical protein
MMPQIGTNVSEVSAATILRAEEVFYSEDKDSRLLQNVCIYLQFARSHPIKLWNFCLKQLFWAQACTSTM